MKEDNDWIEKIIREIVANMLAIITALIILACLLTFCGCKSVEYVPVTQTEYRDREVHDSIFQKLVTTDSIIIREKGDTVWQERWHTIWRDRWHDRTTTDTLYRDREVPVPVPVERKLSRWEQFCLDYGKVTLGGTVCAGLMGIGYVVVWLRRRRL